MPDVLSVCSARPVSTGRTLLARPNPSLHTMWKPRLASFCASFAYEILVLPCSFTLRGLFPMGISASCQRTLLFAHHIFTVFLQASSRWCGWSQRRPCATRSSPSTAHAECTRSRVLLLRSPSPLVWHRGRVMCGKTNPTLALKPPPRFSMDNVWHSSGTLARALECETSSCRSEIVT